MSQLIKDITRLTNSSQTAIDLIIASDPDKVSQSGILPCKISDHNIIYCTRKMKKYQVNKHNVTHIRSMKNYSVNEMLEKLRAITWLLVINEENVDIAWKGLLSCF